MNGNKTEAVKYSYSESVQDPESSETPVWASQNQTNDKYFVENQS
jgi:hypothetical protein